VLPPQPGMRRVLPARWARGGGATWRGAEALCLPGLLPFGPNFSLGPAVSQLFCPPVPPALPVQSQDRPAAPLLLPCSSKEMLRLVLLS